MTDKSKAPMKTKEVALGLKKLSGWKLKNKKLEKLSVFPDFLSAIKYVNHVARLSEKANHHTEIKISYNKVLLTLWSHDFGGLSEKDFSLASKIDQLPSQISK